MTSLTFNPNGSNQFTLSDAELREIGNNGYKNEHILDNIWDKISDFFCNTNRVEAKMHLATLINKGTSGPEKNEAFLRLQALSGDAFTTRFIMNAPETSPTKTITIHFDDDQPYELETNITNENYRPSPLAYYMQEVHGISYADQTHFLTSEENDHSDSEIRTSNGKDEFIMQYYQQFGYV